MNIRNGLSFKGDLSFESLSSGNANSRRSSKHFTSFSRSFFVLTIRCSTAGYIPATTLISFVAVGLAFPCSMSCGLPTKAKSARPSTTALRFATLPARRQRNELSRRIVSDGADQAGAKRVVTTAASPCGDDHAFLIGPPRGVGFEENPGGHRDHRHRQGGIGAPPPPNTRSLSVIGFVHLHRCAPEKESP